MYALFTILSSLAPILTVILNILQMYTEIRIMFVMMLFLSFQTLLIPCVYFAVTSFMRKTE